MKKGEKASEELKLKLRTARARQIMHPRSEETKEKIRQARKKYKISEETKKKISEKLKGRKLLDSTIAKMRLKVLSKETREKISNSNKGSKSHLWRGGITKINTTLRHNLEYKIWRESVFKRDDFTCQKTMQRGGELEAHHIENFSSNEDLRFDINNGITLTKDVHKLFHYTYGVKNNTKEQLDEFLHKQLTSNTYEGEVS